MIPMPHDINLWNACNERCDMADGPCACGAWHGLSDWRHRASKLSGWMPQRAEIAKLVTRLEELPMSKGNEHNWVWGEGWHCQKCGMSARHGGHEECKAPTHGFASHPPEAGRARDPEPRGRMPARYMRTRGSRWREI